MKFLKKIRSNKGFSVTECIVAIGVFTIMASIIMQILAISVARYSQNYKMEKNLDAQIEDIATQNALVERDSVTLAVDFVKNGSGSANADIEIDDISIKKNDSTSELNDGAFELNTMDTSIIPSVDINNSNNSSGGMINESIHLYGTKGADKIYVGTATANNADGTVKLTIQLQITTSKSVFSKAESCSLKLALPKSSKSITITNDSNMGYRLLTGTTIRFCDSDVSSAETSYNITVSCTLTEEEYNTEYISFAKYFISPDSELTDTSATFNDVIAPGVYNHKV